MTAVLFNPFQPGYLANPYDHLGEIRETNPVSMVGDRWGLFRYEDCVGLLRDQTASVEDQNSNVAEDERQKLFVAAVQAHGPGGEEFFDRSMLGRDAPDHTRLRRLVSKAFTPRSIEALRPQVQALVDTALDRIEDNGGGDVISELAFPLPFDVINLMLGMPEADKDQIRTWSGAVVKTLDPFLSPDEITEAVDAGMNMRRHIEAVIAWKRSNLGDDMLSRLIQVEEDGDRLSTRELITQVQLLFIAGHETTVNLIGVGIHELLRHPDQLQAWIGDASCDDVAAVDELLRFISPVQISRRIATRDLTFGDTTIPERSFILAILASANRDPRHFGPTAHQLDLARSDASTHLAFGSGSHFCLGASLARLEAQVCLGRLFRRFPNAAVTEEPVWNGRLNLRGIDRLILSV